MNTLNRAITARFFINDNGYYALREHWSALVRSDRKHELSATHYLLYLVLTGKDWRRGFAPVSNDRKVANGGFYDWELFHVFKTLHTVGREQELLSPFDGLLSPHALELVRKLVPGQSLYKYAPGGFPGGAYPFDAYEIPAEVSGTTEDAAHG